MLHKLPLLALFGLLILPLGAQAAGPSTSLEEEYQQVRRIALRDPKVRAAYEEADRKLESKIVQIDPALAGYVRQRGAGGPPPAAATAPSRQTSSRQAPKPTPAPTPKPFRRAHVVVKGDTLGSIAIKYGVSVAALKSANHITDEKKLVVGHVLAIPNTPSGR